MYKTMKSNKKSASKPPMLELTGVSRNIYLYCIRKAFRAFLNEETRGYAFSDARLQHRIEAARLLFPEDRERLREFLTLKSA